MTMFTGMCLYLRASLHFVLLDSSCIRSEPQPVICSYHGQECNASFVSRTVVSPFGGKQTDGVYIFFFFRKLFVIPAVTLTVTLLASFVGNAARFGEYAVYWKPLYGRVISGWLLPYSGSRNVTAVTVK